MTDEENPLPIGETLEVAEVERRFARTTVRPAANPRFGVELMVPRGWIADTVEGMDREVNAVQLTPLGAWHAPETPNGPIVFHVQAIGLLRDITAAHFIVSYGLKQRLPIVAMREMSPGFADALLHQRIEGQLFCVRMAVRFDGDRAFVWSGIAHERDYATYAETFGVMIATSQLLDPAPSAFPEPRVRRTVLERIQFEAPGSFRALEAADSTELHEAIDLFHKDTKDHFSGFIRLDLDLEARERSIEEELGYVVAHVMARNVELASEYKEIEVDSAPGSIRARKMLIMRGTVPGNDVPQEVWITLLDAGGAALRVFMIGPARDGSFDHWAVNQRAYRVVLSTLAATS